MSRLEQITCSGYQVKVHWECEFDDAGIETPELRAHPAVYQSPLCSRDALYEGRIETMLQNYNAREGETLESVDVMNLYPNICKYFKFPLGHPVKNVVDACKDNEACHRMDGLIKCSIVPQEVYDPVHHFRANQNLKFRLRRTCVLISYNGKCCQRLTRGGP